MNSIAEAAVGDTVDHEAALLDPQALPSTYGAALAVILATLQAKHPDLADVLSRANAVLTQGRFYPGPGGADALVRSHDKQGQEQTYHVDGVACTCDCPRSTHHPEEVCKHRYALRLHKLVMAAHLTTAPPEGEPPAAPLLTEQVSTEEPAMTHDDDIPATYQEEMGAVIAHPSPGPDQALEGAAQTHKVPKEYLQLVHGHPFILYKGLLAMAHEAGLRELHAELILVEPGIIALAKAHAIFADGRRFAEAADATPDNVGDTVKAHFARIALTRAKARCLRDALNIGLCSLEEIGDVSEPVPLPMPQETRWCTEHQATMTPRMSKRTGAPYWSHDGPDGKFCFGD